MEADDDLRRVDYASGCNLSNLQFKLDARHIKGVSNDLRADRSSSSDEEHPFGCPRNGQSSWNYGMS